MSGRQLFLDPIARLISGWWLQRQIKSHESTIAAIGQGIDSAYALRTEMRIEVSGMKLRLARR
jgi:hypothetical protein